MNRLDKAVIEATALDDMNRELKFQLSKVTTVKEQLDVLKRFVALFISVETDTIKIELQKAQANK